MRQHGWHAALDVQLDTHKWHNSDYGRLFIVNFFNSILDDAKATERAHEIPLLRDVLIETLWRADTIFVTKDIEHLLLQAAHDLPDDVSFEAHDVLTPMGFLYLEEPLEGEDVNGRRMTVKAIAWKAQKLLDPESGELIDSFFIYFFSEDHADVEEITKGLKEKGIPCPQLSLLHFYPGMVGAKMPQETVQGTALTSSVVKLFWAFQLLSQQQIVSNQKMVPPRATRRRYNAPKDGWRYISLITLRRKSVKKDDHETQKIDWTHRWVVTGHWRRQWYPKLQRHDWVYISEFVKGPEDKPLWIRDRRIFNFKR